MDKHTLKELLRLLIKSQINQASLFLLHLYRNPLISIIFSLTIFALSAIKEQTNKLRIVWQVKDIQTIQEVVAKEKIIAN
jgi:hypothetical protein